MLEDTEIILIYINLIKHQWSKAVDSKEEHASGVAKKLLRSYVRKKKKSDKA